MYIIVGLGNPGDKFALTRHNAGRMAAEKISKLENSKLKVLVPDTFMNKTGTFVAKFIKNKKAAEKLIVIYDDLDLPPGALKISYNRSSGGHRGVESIIRALKTKEFIRIRIGIGPTSPRLRGASKEVDGEKHILGQFNKSELETLKKVIKRVCEAVTSIAEHGRERAMTEFNSN